jgi:hypothetical protein
MSIDSEDMRFIRNELKYMCDINNIHNLALIEDYGISKFANELRDWNFSDRNIFQQLKI